MYALPDNGLKIEIFIYSLSTYSTTEPDFLLIINYQDFFEKFGKIWKIEKFTVLVVEVK